MNSQRQSAAKAVLVQQEGSSRYKDAEEAMTTGDKILLTKRITAYQDEIHRRNYENFLSLTSGGTIITGVIVIIGLFMRAYTSFFKEFLIFFVYMLLMHNVAKYCQKHQVKRIELIYYLAITPVMFGGIMMGSFLDTDQPAITIMILLCVMTLFVIDHPLRIFGYMSSVAVIFAVCAYVTKNQAQFMADMVDLLVYFSIGVGVNYFMLVGQVESVENFCMIQHKSERDLLTGIYNRGSGEERIVDHIQNKRPGAFIILDVDDFKKVNDAYGHIGGDQVLCGVAGILKDAFRPQDTVFRLGGDEFAIFAPGMTKEACKQRFERIRQAAASIYVSGFGSIKIGISIGCTIYQGEDISFEQIYHSSDEALYWAKENGKDRYKICYYKA